MQQYTGNIMGSKSKIPGYISPFIKFPDFAMKFSHLVFKFPDFSRTRIVFQFSLSRWTLSCWSLVFWTLCSIRSYSMTESQCTFNMKQRSLTWGGGGKRYFYELLMALYFNIFLNNLSLLRNINWGSYEKIIRFYFLHEILNESIFFKKIS